MPRYRARSAVVETVTAAELLDAQKVAFARFPAWVGESAARGDIVVAGTVVYLRGGPVKPDAVVVRDSNGTLSPVTPEALAASYEPEPETP
jgi:hypothetical protein